MFFRVTLLTISIIASAAIAEAKNKLFCNSAGFRSGECGYKLGCVISESTTGFVCPENRPVIPDPVVMPKFDNPFISQTIAIDLGYNSALKYRVNVPDVMNRE